MRQNNLAGFFGGVDKVYKSLESKLMCIEEAEKSDKSVRDLERVLFTPKDVRSVVIEDKDIKLFNSVKIYFGDENFYKLFIKYFKVNTYVEVNVHRIDVLVLFLLLLEKGYIIKEDIESGVRFKFIVKEAEFFDYEL